MSGRPLAFAGVLLLATCVGSGAELFADDFEAPLDPGIWTTPTGDPSFVGRTQFRPELPTVGGGVLALPLDTHNPSALVPGDSFLGTDVFTRAAFARGAGIAFEARARWRAPLSCGLVGAPFLYAFFEADGTRDEIDFELLSNDAVGAFEHVLTNVFAARGFGPGEAAGMPVHAGVDGLDLSAFHVYRIEWRPDSVRWLVDGVLVREELGEVPERPMHLHLNVWAPAAVFAQAWCETLEPAADPDANQTFHFEVDRVSVTTLPEPGPRSALAALAAARLFTRRRR